jgi:hypothetical protein
MASDMLDVLAICCTLFSVMACTPDPVELATAPVDSSGSATMNVTVDKADRLAVRVDIIAQEERDHGGFVNAVNETKLQLSVKNAQGVVTQTTCKLCNGTSHGDGTDNRKRWPRRTAAESDCRLALEPGTSEVKIEVAWTEKGPYPRIVAHAVAAR